jgi:superfamily II DNA or RNA helicase
MAATGFGKTVVAASIIQQAIAKGSRVIFAVHRDILMEQTAGTLTEFGVPHGFIRAGMPYDKSHQVHIASIQTLAKRLIEVGAIDLLVVDECHLAMAKTWIAVIEHFKTAGARILGLSGSPQRLDGRGLGYLFSAMVQGPPTAWLIERGLLSEYRYFAPSAPDLTGVGRVMGDFSPRELEAAVSTKTLIGDVVAYWRPYAETHRCLAFTVSHAHSDHLIAEFSAAGIRSASITGKHSTADRKRIISAFADREIQVLLNVELITTGFDLAAAVGREVTVDGIIQARPTESLALYLQMVGRGLRAKKHPCIILDHAGNSARHRFPDSPREWSLDDKARKGPTKLPPPPLDCAKCLCQVRQPPPTACPHCGVPWVSTPASGQRAYDYDAAARLSEVTKEQREAAERAARIGRTTEEARCKTLEDFIALGRARGYERAEAWAGHRMAARQGR